MAASAGKAVSAWEPVDEDEWEDVEWEDFCAWLQGKVVVESTTSLEYVELHFADGCGARVSSEQTKHYSNDTPAMLKPPTVKTWEPG